MPIQTGVYRYKSLRWEFIKENKKARKKESKHALNQENDQGKKSFFLSWLLSWSRASFLSFFLTVIVFFFLIYFFGESVFYFSFFFMIAFLIESVFSCFFYKFPPQVVECRLLVYLKNLLVKRWPCIGDVFLFFPDYGIVGLGIIVYFANISFISYR